MRQRAIAFLIVWSIVQSLMITLYLKSHGTDNSPNLVFLVAFLGAPLGPFAGGVARYSQQSCMEFSIKILPWFLPFAIIALLSLLIKTGSAGWAKISALFIWGSGCLIWMIGAVASFGFAIG